MDRELSDRVAELEARVALLEQVNRGRLIAAANGGFVPAGTSLPHDRTAEAPARPVSPELAAATRELEEAQAAHNALLLEFQQPGRGPRRFVPAHVEQGVFLDDEARAYKRDVFGVPPERKGEYERVRGRLEEALVAYNKAAGIIPRDANAPQYGHMVAF